MKTFQFFLLVFGTLFVLLLSGCERGRAEATPTAQQSAAHETATSNTITRQVRVVAVEEGVLETKRSTSVTIEPASQSQVAAEASGQVAQVLAREGTLVNQGDVVIQIATENLTLQVEASRLAVQTAQVNLETAQRASGDGLSQAQGGLTTAQTALQLAEKQYQEGQKLLEAGGLSPSELLGLESQYNQAKAAFDQAQAAVNKSNRADSEDLELLRLQVQQAQTQLSQAEKALRDASIRTPFSGEIAEVLVNQGEFIGAGSPTFRIISNEGQLAKFSVPVGDAAFLAQQETLQIPYGSLSYAAHVLRTAPIPNQSRLVAVTTAVYPSEERIPNGTVTTLEYRVSLAEGLIVPSAAVQLSSGQSFVYTVEDGVAKRQEVSVVSENAGSAVITGLSKAARVIYPVPSDLVNNTPVEVVSSTVTSEVASQ